MAIDEVFGSASQYNLTGNTNSGIFLETDRRLLLVSVVEYNGDTSFRDAGLPTLVNEILRPLVPAHYEDF